ncbi:MAG: hypothetical protein RR087_10330 [Oscillospiraceae bacterium]
MKNKKTMLMVGVFMIVAFITCCTFPFLNLTKETPIRMDMLSWLVIGISIMFYCNIGQFEAKLFSGSSVIFIALFNFIATAFGMGSRYLIEFGEVSNVYNFTLPNIILQVLVSVLLTSGACLFAKKTESSN